MCYYPTTPTLLTYHLYTWWLGPYPIHRWLDSAGRTCGPFWASRNRAVEWGRERLGITPA